MRYVEYPVDPALRHLFVNFWYFTLDERDPERFEHTIVPDGTASIGYTRPASNVDAIATFVGPRVTAARVQVVAGAKYCGIRLQPGAAGAALGLRVDGLRDRLGPLMFISKRAATLMVDALRVAKEEAEFVSGLDRVARTLACDALEVDALVVKAVDAILDSDGAARIVDVAAAVGIGERQLQRRFRAAVGLTPKEFSRMRRIRHACLLAITDKDHGLAGVSTDAGFADQAHLTREFSGVFGWSPRLLLAYLDRIEHGNIV